MLSLIFYILLEKLKAKKHALQKGNIIKYNFFLTDEMLGLAPSILDLKEMGAA